MKSDNRYVVLIIIIALLLLNLILIIRLLQYKKQIRSFVAMTKARQDIEMNRPVTVDYFDRDILELAKILNEYTDMQKQIAIEYEKDKKNLNTIIAGISHDFRTPLTAAKGYMQLIDKNDNLDAQDKMYLKIAIEKTDYLKKLSDEFFEIASLKAADGDIEKKKVNLNKLLMECILSQHKWISDSGIKAVFDIPESDIYDILIITNEHFLIRIIENLFSNVRKYAKSELEFKVMADNKKVVISMENDISTTDTIDAEKVFEPFYRYNSGYGQGSGLGLYVVKCLSEQLGYKVFAECRDNKFYISLEISL